MKRSGSRTAPDWPAVFAQLARTARDPRLVRFYEAGTVSADTPLEQVPLLALDVETTGLDSQRDSIVSLGLMPWSWSLSQVIADPRPQYPGRGSFSSPRLRKVCP